MEDAQDLIDESLNVITIVKKLNLVTVMAKMLFNRHDEALIPASSLAFHQLQKYTKEPKLKKEFSFIKIDKNSKDSTLTAKSGRLYLI